MIDSGNSLSIWERKSEYFCNIKTGNNIEEVKGLLEKGLRNQLANNIQGVNSAIASQDIVNEISKTREGLNETFKMIYNNFQELTEGIDKLSFAFEWGISEVVWQIEQTRQVAKEILSVLMAPLDTQAKELRKRAAMAYVDGLYEDALLDFQESIQKNRYDYMVHMTMGMIYTFHVVDNEKALKSFEQVVKYSKPRFPYHASLGLMHKGMVLVRMGKLKEAENATMEAINLSPGLLEAYYQNAQYNAMLQNYSEASKKLSFLINNDYRYLFKASKDEIFNSREIKLEVDNLSKQKRDEFVAIAKNKLSALKKEVSKLFLDLKEINKVIGGNINDPLILGLISQIEKRIHKNSIIDALKCDLLFKDVEFRLLSLRKEVKGYIAKVDNDLPSRKRVIDRKLKEISDYINSRPQFYTYDEQEKAKSKFDILFLFIAIALFLFGTFFGLRIFDSEESNWIMGVVFVIGGFVIGEAAGIFSIIRESAMESHVEDLKMAKRNKHLGEIKSLNNEKEKIETEVGKIMSIRKIIELL